MALALKKLLPALQDWQQAGLIKAEQRDAILQFENARAKAFNPMAWLAAAGGLCVLLGVILLVSHNWENLGPLFKQGSFIGALAALALAADRFEEKPWLGPAIFVVWLGLPLAGIGLWGQIYHLSGDPLKPLLVWLALSAPIAYFGRHPAAAIAHTAGLALAATVGAFSAGTWLTLADTSWWRNPDRPFDPSRWGLNLLGVLLLWALASWQAHARLGTGPRVLLLLAMGAFMAALGFAHTPLQCEHVWLGMLMVAGIGVCVWFGSWAWGLRGTRLREIGFGLSAAFLYALSFTRFVTDAGHFTGGGIAWSLAWGLGGLGLAIFGPWDKMQLSKRWVGPLTALLPLGLIFFGILGLPGWSVGALANFSLAGLCVVWMFEAAAQEEKALLNRATWILGLLIFTRFVDYLGSLLNSGLGFIGAGLLFLGVAWALNEGRKSLLEGAGKGAQP